MRRSIFFFLQQSICYQVAVSYSSIYNTIAVLVTFRFLLRARSMAENQVRSRRKSNKRPATPVAEASEFDFVVRALALSFIARSASDLIILR
jgi:hypothetical protein